MKGTSIQIGANAVLCTSIDTIYFEGMQFKEGSAIRETDVLGLGIKTYVQSPQAAFGNKYASLNSVLVQLGSNASAGIVLGTFSAVYVVIAAPP